MTLPATIQDNVKERIKLIVGELIPEETYDKIVTATIHEFMQTDLPKLVKAELTEKYKVLISESLSGPEWQTGWEGNQQVASEAVKAILIASAPDILAGLIGFSAEQVVMNFRNQMQQYRPY